MYLEHIKSPEDIKGYDEEQLAVLAREIREKIIHTVAQNGGHLASNLGVVEITLAMHRAFHTPVDKIIFDVGHQSYVHKLLTGRFDQFDTIRQYGGLSGFPKREESVHDCFETGHASTSISAALGFARARDIRGSNEQVVALIGDGALTGGMCYEALNDAGSSQTPFIVILNDNEMSISKNVGALSSYLTHLRVSKKWNETKKAVKFGLNKIPLIGKPLSKGIERFKDMIRGMVIDESFFETLGFQYLGPIDGHDIKTLEYVFNSAKALKKPVVIHCITKKGFGYEIAESAPDLFHGASPFAIDSGEALEMKNGKTCGEVAGEALITLAQKDEAITVITAAMPIGTGMDGFQKAFPSRFADVGIAEGHAVTMAAGMAAGGVHPYVAIYSTFLQRSYDQLLHDVALQNLSLCFLLDRAGISGADGQTHHGLYDFAYLRSMPNMTILAPKDLKELTKILIYTSGHQGPCAVRYPRSLPEEILPETPIQVGEEAFTPGSWQVMKTGNNCLILAIGSMVGEALKTAQILKEDFRISAMVVSASSLRPLDHKMLKEAKDIPLITIEEHVIEGGFGSAVDEFCVANRLPAPLISFGVKGILPHGERKQLLALARLNAATMAPTIAKEIRERGNDERKNTGGYSLGTTRIG